jgi:hypothetical protein
MSPKRIVMPVTADTIADLKGWLLDTAGIHEKAISKVLKICEDNDVYGTEDLEAYASSDIDGFFSKPVASKIKRGLGKVNRGFIDRAPPAPAYVPALAHDATKAVAHLSSGDSSDEDEFKSMDQLSKPSPAKRRVKHPEEENPCSKEGAAGGSSKNHRPKGALAAAVKVIAEPPSERVHV